MHRARPLAILELSSGEDAIGVGGEGESRRAAEFDIGREEERDVASQRVEEAVLRVGLGAARLRNEVVEEGDVGIVVVGVRRGSGAESVE